MNDIKKGLIELVKLVEARKGKIIDDKFIEDFRYYCVSKKKSSVILLDNDNIVGKFCWYHKKWELFKDNEFGIKSGDPSGFNSMCKSGVSSWTRSQLAIKKLDAEALKKVKSGKLKINDIEKFVNNETEKLKVIEYPDKYKGYDDKVKALKEVKNEK